jgi:rod shape-determining protein MreC
MKLRWWITSLLVLIASAMIALAGFARPLRDSAVAILLPVARVFAPIGSGIARMLHADPGARQAEATIQDLQQRLSAETVDYVRLRALEEENSLLRAQANFISEHGYKTLGARVISRAIEHESAVVTLDRGKRDGAAVGYAVVAEGGILVGKIIDTGEYTSSVMLVSDTRSRVAASISGAKGVMGVVEGRGDGITHLTLVPQSAPLEKNQVIVTSGTEESVPANLVVGLVNDVASAATDPFKDAVVEPLAPLDHLEIVSIIIPGSS